VTEGQIEVVQISGLGRILGGSCVRIYESADRHYIPERRINPIVAARRIAALTSTPKNGTDK
jgi:hypothetical protein